MNPSSKVIDFVQSKQDALPWIYWSEDEKRLVFNINNTYLSMYRSCPSYFFLKAVEGWARRSGGTVARNWFLDFGSLFHKLMEVYYKHFREADFDLNKFAIQRAGDFWESMKMDEHMGHKEFLSIGGYQGFAAMLIQYAIQFKPENERIKVLATEVSFGRGREVPIYQSFGSNAECGADIYLSGRLDIIADDGYYIFPLDHKTMGAFKGDPLVRFLNDDGPTGYVYCLKKILPTIIPEELILKRDCKMISMNLISKSIPKEGSRFKRLSLRKTESQMVSYRERVISTCNHILTDLECYVRGQSIMRNTSNCTDWYHHECDYIDVHRQSDRAAELATLSNGYVQLPIWNTETVEAAEA
jgi:hypothetical protein